MFGSFLVIFFHFYSEKIEEWEFKVGFELETDDTMLRSLFLNSWCKSLTDFFKQGSLITELAKLLSSRRFWLGSVFSQRSDALRRDPTRPALLLPSQWDITGTGTTANTADVYFRKNHTRGNKKLWRPVIATGVLGSNRAHEEPHLRPTCAG